MLEPHMRPSVARVRLIRLHRWIGLACAPVLVLILVTGILLALRPFLAPRRSSTAVTPVDIHRVAAALARVERHARVAFAGIEDDRRTLTIFLAGRAAPESFDLASGAAVATPPQTPPDVWDRILEAHKNLWFGLGGLVTLATLGMLVLVLLGPFVGRPITAPGSLREWHVSAGWFLWPVIALLPGSVVLMKVHPSVVAEESATPMGLAAALDTAAGQMNLSEFEGVQRIRNSTAILLTRGVDGPRRYVLHPDRISPLDSPVSRLGRSLHEGTWAGRWSGLLNALAGFLNLGLIGVGVASWLRRRGVREARRGGTAPVDASAAA
jgi:sulfite reductase (NADPH) flavoprotein alpha-component